MTDYYPFCRLSAVASVQGGFAFKSSDFTETGVPVLKIKNVRLREVDTTEPAYVDQSLARDTARYFCKSGDILISMTGSGPQAPNSVVGRVARFTGESDRYLINQRVGRFLNNAPDKLDQRYLFYVLAQNETLWKLVSVATGSANQANISGSQIESLEITLPPLAEQKAIAAILGSLDDKIEINRRMNATLEAMARALFQSWFVDFDPVRAKLDGRVPVGMDAETAALFLDAFQDSALGHIPKGWTATTLGDACKHGGGNVQTGPFGTQLHAADYVDEGIPSIMPSDLRDNRIDVSSISRIREHDAERLSVYRVQKGDVVYSRRGDVERRALIRTNEEGWLCGTGCLRVRFGQIGLNPFFGASYLGSLESRAWVVRHAVGATMPNLNTSILGSLPMIVPPQKLQERFAQIVGSWDERGTIALEQSRTLATLRDTLLPKLLSGELSVAGFSAELVAL